MSTVVEPARTAPPDPETVPRRTVADMLAELGDIPPSRIRLIPPPGTATIADVVRVLDHENIPCELIDGILVEKAMGWFESRVAVALSFVIQSWLQDHPLGIVLGADATLQILPNLVREPDVSFLSWDRFPDRKPPQEPVPLLAPDLAVEVLSESNTPGEMRRKVREYFESGARAVWLIDPKSRSARVWLSVGEVREISPDGELTAGDVLPGFSLRLEELFRLAWPAGTDPSGTTGSS